MGIKKYFTGKTGFVFWLNIVLAIVVLISIPIIMFNTLDAYTNHGEKVSVPSVVGKSTFEAESALDKLGFVAVVSDSIYRKGAKPGIVLDQNPKAGSLIKGGRIIYLTVNLNGEPLVKLPDLAHNSSLREAEAVLKSLGFKLTEPKYVMGEAKDLVLKIRQGNRDVHFNEMISRERALTIYAGGGEEVNDSLFFDESELEYEYDDENTSESNFDVQL